MVLLLNLLPYIVLAIAALVAYKLKKIYPIIIGVVLIMIYMYAQPSYMPKGTVKPLVNPGFELIETPIEDRQLKAKPAAQRDAKMAEYEKQSDARREALIEQIKSDKE